MRAPVHFLYSSLPCPQQLDSLTLGERVRVRERLAIGGLPYRVSLKTGERYRPLLDPRFRGDDIPERFRVCYPIKAGTVF